MDPTTSSLHPSDVKSVTGIALHVEKYEDEDAQVLTFYKSTSKVVDIGRKSTHPKGRSRPDNAAALFRCPVISRRHAKITFVDYRSVQIVDLSSHHGTHILRPGDTVSKAIAPDVPSILSDGDVVTFGKSVGRDETLVRPVTLRVQLIFDMAPASSLSTPITPGLPHAMRSIAVSRSGGRYGMYPRSSSSSSSRSSSPARSKSGNGDGDSDIEEIQRPLTLFPARPHSFLFLPPEIRSGRFGLLRRLLPPIHNADFSSTGATTSSPISVSSTSSSPETRHVDLPSEDKDIEFVGVSREVEEIFPDIVEVHPDIEEIQPQHGERSEQIGQHNDPSVVGAWPGSREPSRHPSPLSQVEPVELCSATSDTSLRALDPLSESWPFVSLLPQPVNDAQQDDDGEAPMLIDRESEEPEALSPTDDSEINTAPLALKEDTPVSRGDDEISVSARSESQEAQEQNAETVPSIHSDRAEVGSRCDSRVEPSRVGSYSPRYSPAPPDLLALSHNWSFGASLYPPNFMSLSSNPTPRSSSAGHTPPPPEFFSLRSNMSPRDTCVGHTPYPHTLPNSYHPPLDGFDARMESLKSRLADLEKQLLEKQENNISTDVNDDQVQAQMPDEATMQLKIEADAAVTTLKDMVAAMEELRKKSEVDAAQGLDAIRAARAEAATAATEAKAHALALASLTAQAQALAVQPAAAEIEDEVPSKLAMLKRKRDEDADGDGYGDTGVDFRAGHPESCVGAVYRATASPADMVLEQVTETGVQVDAVALMPEPEVRPAKRRKALRIVEGVAKTTAIAAIGAVAAWSALAFS